MMKQRLQFFLLVFLVLFSSMFYASDDRVMVHYYYKGTGNVRKGFNVVGKRLNKKPATSIYAISYEDVLGRKKKITFYKNGKLVERKLYRDDGSISYFEGKSYFKPGAWFDVIYTYRDGNSMFKSFLKEIDYKIYTSKTKNQNKVIYREITKFKLKKKFEKYWNIMYRRDFLPKNKLHHYWIFNYPSLVSEKPSKVLEYNFSGVLIRKGTYVKRNNREILIFKKVGNSR